MTPHERFVEAVARVTAKLDEEARALAEPSTKLDRGWGKPHNRARGRAKGMALARAKKGMKGW